MRKALTFVSCAAVAAALGSTSLAHAAVVNLLNNGDFNTPVGGAPNGIPTNGQSPFYVFNSSSTGLTGWTVTQGSVDLVPNTLWQSATGAPNTFSVDLVGTPANQNDATPQTGGITQTVTGLTVGDTYEFSYEYTVNPGTDSYNDQLKNKILSVLVTAPANQEIADALSKDTTSAIESTNTSDVVLYNPPNLVLTDGTRTFTNMQWQTVTTTFVAPSDEVTIAFAAVENDPTHPNNTVTNDVLTGPVIDQVLLQDISGGGGQTPEPASLGMLGAGFVGLVVRRRQRA